MRVILTAHNQFRLVQQRLIELQEVTGLSANDIIIVDNASEDGLAEWLGSQMIYSYLICDEGMETYAKIMNTAIAELSEEEDIFCYTPDYQLKTGMLEEMKNLLYSKEEIAAVSPAVVGDETEISSFFSEERADKNKMELAEGIVLMKYSAYKKIGKFDERLLSSNIAMKDFLFRGLCLGYKFMECGKAYSFCPAKAAEVYLQDCDVTEQREILKEKWGMNYFNTKPNASLVELIKADKNQEINILEIGCDCGANLLEIRNCYPNAKLYGVEINEQAAKIAGHIAEVKTGDIEERNLDFGDIKFDYILFGDVLEHLKNPAAVIKYCKLLLKDDGGIAACIPNLMHYSVMRGLLNGNFTYSDRGLLDRTHIHFFTFKEIIRMFTQEGYVMETVGIRVGEMLPEDEAFVDRLMEISGDVERFMFCAVQYEVTAVIK